MQPTESNQLAAVNSRQTLQGTDMDIKELALKIAEEMGGNLYTLMDRCEDFATRLIAAYTEGQEPDESQNWKGMSGAVAWHLIDRHGEDWADIGNKMDAWLKANTAPPLPAIPDERIATLEQQNAELVSALETMSHWHGDDRFDSLIAKVKQP